MKKLFAAQTQIAASNVIYLLLITYCCCVSLIFVYIIILIKLWLNGTVRFGIYHATSAKGPVSVGHNVSTLSSLTQRCSFSVTVSRP